MPPLPRLLYLSGILSVMPVDLHSESQYRFTRQFTGARRLLSSSLDGLGNSHPVRIRDKGPSESIGAEFIHNTPTHSLNSTSQMATFPLRAD